jgi:hypothetical protein
MRVIRLSPAKLQDVRNAWHGPLTREQVAGRFGLSEKAVRTIWKKARVAGALPTGCRPHFQQREAGALPIAEVDFEGPITDAEISEGEREAKLTSWINARSCYALLAALRADHSDNRAAHTAPAEWLRFDGKGQREPTPAELTAMCSAHDAAAAKNKFNRKA